MHGCRPARKPAVLLQCLALLNHREYNVMRACMFASQLQMRKYQRRVGAFSRLGFITKLIPEHSRLRHPQLGRLLQPDIAD